MADSTFLLYQMQKIDSAQRSVELSIKKHLEEIGNLSAINEAELHLEKLSKLVNIEKVEIVNLEKRITESKNKSTQFNSSLYGGKIVNPKELQNLQIEIASLEKNVSTLETTLLGKMETLEQLQAALDLAFQEASTVKSQKTAKNAILNEKIEAAKKEKSKLEKEKEGIRGQLSVAFLNTYDQMSTTKKGTAVSLVEEGCCQSCGTTLTPSDCQQAKNYTAIIYCTNCGRILYAG